MQTEYLTKREREKLSLARQMLSTITEEREKRLCLAVATVYDMEPELVNIKHGHTRGQALPRKIFYYGLYYLLGYSQARICSTADVPQAIVSKNICHTGRLIKEYPSIAAKWEAIQFLYYEN